MDSLALLCSARGNERAKVETGKETVDNKLGTYIRNVTGGRFAGAQIHDGDADVEFLPTTQKMPRTGAGG